MLDEQLLIAHAHHAGIRGGKQLFPGAEIPHTCERDFFELLTGGRIEHEHALLIPRADVEPPVHHGDAAEVELLQIRLRVHFHRVHRQAAPLPGPLDELSGADLITANRDLPRRFPIRRGHVLLAAPCEPILSAIKILRVRSDGVVLDAVAVLMLVALHELALVVQRHERPTTLRDRRGKKHPLPIRRRRVQRAVIRPPGTRRRLVTVPEVRAIARADAFMRHRPPGVAARSHEFSGLIETIPDHILLPCREGATRDEIAHPLALFVFDDDARLAFLRLLEAQANLLLTRRYRLAMRRQIKLRPRSRIVIECRVHCPVIGETETLPLTLVLKGDGDVKLLRPTLRQRHPRCIRRDRFFTIENANAQLLGGRLHCHRAVRDFDFHRNATRTAREHFCL